ncbi:MAG: NADP-reducing hydrogenase subunit HndA [Candidatus Heimdallarchaeota archaeon LC_2]|nr:MAG: NADP-reducing hydrogenase subunit HndA [Candidatus Heimdallarchaeota archaeon LC_2]
MQIFSETDEILRKYEFKGSSIIQILSDLQNSHSYLPFKELEYISKRLNLPLSKIFGIITFYADFKLNQPGKYNIKSCHGTACYVKNAEMITNTLKFDFEIEPGKTTSDELFSMEHISCIGACALAPVLEINGEVYGEMDSKKMRRIIKKLKREEENS